MSRIWCSFSLRISHWKKMILSKYRKLCYTQKWFRLQDSPLTPTDIKKGLRKAQRMRYNLTNKSFLTVNRYACAHWVMVEILHSVFTCNILMRTLQRIPMGTSCSKKMGFLTTQRTTLLLYPLWLMNSSTKWCKPVSLSYLRRLVRISFQRNKHDGSYKRHSRKIMSELRRQSEAYGRKRLRMRVFGKRRNEL